MIVIFSVIAAALVAGISVTLGIGMAGPAPETSTNGTIPPSVQPANNITTTNVANNDTATATTAVHNDTFTVMPDPDLPKVQDASLRVEKVIEGLALPTSMAFVGHDDILVLQKDNGMVRLVSNGALEQAPVLDVFVERQSERGLLGIAVAGEANNQTAKTVFLYYTEDSADGVRNRIYKYSWSGAGNLTGGELIMDLPGTPGPNHDGGKLAIGPDGLLYAVIGDLNRNGMLQNFEDGAEPDDTSVILRMDYGGNATGAILSFGGDAVIDEVVSMYYAYGIRNSFGMAFDPVTGALWDTENGPSGYDEINLVRPGFNSGWEAVMGPMDRAGRTASDLVQFDGSQYSDPLFSWRDSVGLTDIEFLNSTRLGEKYASNVFVGDINNGNLYYFEVNGDRTGLVLDNSELQDLVADNNGEASAVTLGTGFGGITDIETGPDGYLYILTFEGSIYRIVPA